MPDVPEQPESELPRQAIEALRRLELAPRVPAHVDQFILSAARIRLAGRRRLLARFRWAAASGAAAAIVLVTLFIAHSPAPRARVAVLGDVNGDGRVDIVDAYLVAKAIAQHQKLSPAWDVNGDGVIDQKDVDLIAQRAVRLAESPQEGAAR